MRYEKRETLSYGLGNSEEGLRTFNDNIQVISVYSEETNTWEVIKDIKKLKSIFHIMIMEYSCRRIVDKNIVDELVYFPYLVYDCRYNIKEKKKEIENIAYEFFKLREKILDNTYEFVMNEKEENYCEEQYTKMLELEIECWKTSLGQTGFISVYEKTKKFDIYSSDIFLKKLKEIIEISKK